MNVLICGYLGFMGRAVEELCKNSYLDAEFVMGVDRLANMNEEKHRFSSFSEIKDSSLVDCIIDFSSPVATENLLAFATERKIPAVIATTGHSHDALRSIRKSSSGIPIFYSANMSFGTALMAELAKRTVSAYCDADVEIIEKHHKRKNDAPSGTAKMLFDAISEVRPDSVAVCGRRGESRRGEKEIGIHSLRIGSAVGEHEIIIATDLETITIRHRAENRALYAKGALMAAKFLVNCVPGLYGMKNLTYECFR